MPRRNKMIPHQRNNFTALAHTAPKRAFVSKQTAEQAVQEAARYNPDLKLYTYQTPVDGKWYLSSKKTTNN